MNPFIYCAALAALLLALAVPGALAQAVQFVPQGCQGLRVAVSASASGSYFFGYSIGGTVTLSNPNEFAIPIQQVQVKLANNQGYPPLTAIADCPRQSVPSNPQAYALGVMRCTYIISLPSNGGATSRPSAWNTALATASINLSGASCSSRATNIQQSSPPFSGGGTCPSPITVTASQSSDQSQVEGTVVFQNGGWGNIYLSGTPTYSVSAGEYDDGSPLSGSVSCPSLTVPWTWRPGGYGSLTCTFTAYPDPPSAYSTAFVTATVGSGRSCPSGNVEVQQLLGGGNIGSSSSGGSGSSGSTQSGGSGSSSSSGGSGSGSGGSGGEYDDSTGSGNGSSGSGSTGSGGGSSSSGGSSGSGGSGGEYDDSTGSGNGGSGDGGGSSSSNGGSSGSGGSGGEYNDNADAAGGNTGSNSTSGPLLQGRRLMMKFA